MRRAALFVLAIPLSALAADDFFENQVRSLLASRCYACHAQTASGGLRLDSRDGLMKGGHRGAAVKSGDAEGSLLMQALRGASGLKAMPPGAPLAATEIAIFERWIREGAVFPALVPNALVPNARGKTLWSLQPLPAPAKFQ